MMKKIRMRGWRGCHGSLRSRRMFSVCLGCLPISPPPFPCSCAGFLSLRFLFFLCCPLLCCVHILALPRDGNIGGECFEIFGNIFIPPMWKLFFHPFGFPVLLLSSPTLNRFFILYGWCKAENTLDLLFIDSVQIFVRDMLDTQDVFSLNVSSVSLENMLSYFFDDTLCVYCSYCSDFMECWFCADLMNWTADFPTWAICFFTFSSMEFLISMYCLCLL